MRTALQSFVAAVCDPDSPGYLPPQRRIAVFANDGTLCCEFPLPAHALFIGARLAELAAQRPSLRDRHPFSAFLHEDLPRVHGLGWRGILQLGMVVHAGLPLEDFTARALGWLERARHPWLGRPLRACAYLPQLELLAWLAQQGFTCFVVTAGEAGFVRALAAASYGIPAPQVIGTWTRTKVEASLWGEQLVKLAQEERFNEREEKVRSIAMHVGLRPVLAFGNADRDLAMLRYVASGSGPRLSLLLRHDDGAREFAYDAGFSLNPSDEALERATECGVQVVSMRNDWAAVFAPSPE